MDDPSTEEIISLVYSMFKVINFNKENYSLEFKIEDSDFNSKFEELARKLQDLSYLGKLEKMDNENYIIIQKFPPRKKRRLLSSSWVPRILFTFRQKLFLAKINTKDYQTDLILWLSFRFGVRFFSYFLARLIFFITIFIQLIRVTIRVLILPGAIKFQGNKITLAFFV